MLRTDTEKPTVIGRVLILGFLLAALMSVSTMLATNKPAHAAVSSIVDREGDQPDASTSDGRCDIDTNAANGNQCTLRAAIQQSNASPGKDFISFNINAPGVRTIAPTSKLPDITDAVTIDGYSQPGAEPNSRPSGNDAVLMIELSGASAGQADGLVIRAGDVEVKGLVVNRFASDGIDVKAGGTFKRIEGNFIGTDASGTQDRGNGGDGVQLESIDAFVGGFNRDDPNFIAFNGGNGVEVTGDANAENRILRNSIFSNDGLGIDLGGNGPTANDDKDPDAGPNSLQNFPVIESATNAGGQTTISGQINSNPNKPLFLEFFSNPAGEDEGKTHLEQEVLSTDSNGVATFSVVLDQAVPVGQTVTATATGSTTGDTSEFSAPVTVDDAPPPPENEAPVATDDSRNAKPGKTLNVAAPGVLANDSDPDDDRLTAALVSKPAKGRLTLNADGSFSYKPKRGFDKGTDSFTYRASDGNGGTDTARVTIKMQKKR